MGVAVVRQYERGVVFRLERVRNVREPGLRLMITLVDSIGVAAVAYYRRVDPVKSIVEIENVEAAINPIAQPRSSRRNSSIVTGPQARSASRSAG